MVKMRSGGYYVSGSPTCVKQSAIHGNKEDKEKGVERTKQSTEKRGTRGGTTYLLREEGRRENSIIMAARETRFWARKRNLHVVHEKGMVCPGGDYSHFDPMLQIPVKELIIYKYLRFPQSRGSNSETWPIIVVNNKHDPAGTLSREFK